MYTASQQTKAAHTVLLLHVESAAHLAAAIMDYQPPPAMEMGAFLAALRSQLELGPAALMQPVLELEDAGLVCTSLRRRWHRGPEFTVGFPNMWMVLQAALNLGHGIDHVATGSLSFAEVASLFMPAAQQASRHNVRLVAQSLVHHSDTLLEALGVTAAAGRHLQLQLPPGFKAHMPTVPDASRGASAGATLADNNIFGLVCEQNAGIKDQHATTTALTFSFGLDADGRAYGASDEASRGAGESASAGKVGESPRALVIVRVQVRLGCGEAPLAEVKHWIEAFDAGVLLIQQQLEAQGVDVPKCRVLRLWWVARPLSAPARRLLTDDVAGGKGLVVHQGNMRQWWSSRVKHTLKLVAQLSGSSTLRRSGLLAAYGFAHRKRHAHKDKAKKRERRMQTREGRKTAQNMG